MKQEYRFCDQRSDITKREYRCSDQSSDFLKPKYPYCDRSRDILKREYIYSATGQRERLADDAFLAVDDVDLAFDGSSEALALEVEYLGEVTLSISFELDDAIGLLNDDAEACTTL